MKKCGFTLNEVLLSLAIIGVITSLTIPNVMSNYQKKVYVTELHKVYNDINSAISKYMANQHVDNLDDSSITDNQGIRNFITTYFEVAKDCDSSCYKSEDEKCFAKNYKYINGNSLDYENKSCDIVFITKSGASVCANVSNSGNRVLDFTIDTNGADGPNIVGRDLYTDVDVKTDGTVYSSSYVSDANTPDSYFGRILNNNWDMNY